jgi:glycosyltransferase involved in cell wall biosynthesis
MHFVLIGNYQPDQQESMERFAQMMADGFFQAGHTYEIWRPTVFFGAKVKSTLAGLGKWLGYVDKWILFPAVLKWRLLNKKYKAENVRFHLCDHSNAFYLNQLPSEKTAITCHDVLAIRGALGYKDAYCPSSATGKILQKWILRNLAKARLLATVSELTLNQLKDLLGDHLSELSQRNWGVIHNAFNADFTPLAPEVANRIIVKAGVPANRPYLLHIGSNLARKNRVLLVEMLAALGKNWDGVVVLAGKAPDDKLMSKAMELGVGDRIISIVKPSHETLVALYSGCEAFVFPSFSEGFGWPVIEAQACAAPVIASNIEPMPEVSGGAALHANPYKPAEFADAFLRLKDETLRNQLKEKGLRNIKRFSPDKMIEAYLVLHTSEKKLIYCE